MATRPFLALALSNGKAIDVQIPTRLATETTGLPDTTGLSNKHILGLYIAGYERLAEITPSSQNWRYMEFQVELEEVQIILRDGRGRKQLSEKSEFLTQCKDEKYRR